MHARTYDRAARAHTQMLINYALVCITGAALVGLHRQGVGLLKALRIIEGAWSNVERACFIFP